MRGRLLSIAIGLAALAAPGTAGAATVGVAADPGQPTTTVATLTAAPGETNDVTVTPNAGGAGVIAVDAGAVLTAGSGCQSLDAHTARCADALPITTVLLDLGDGSDRADLDRFDGSSTVDAGPGDDAVRGARSVVGGLGDDRLRGAGPGSTVGSSLDGGPGADRLDGARGDNRFAGGPGTDRFRCGAGFDVLTDVDRAELVPPGCDRLETATDSREELVLRLQPVRTRPNELRFELFCFDEFGYENPCTGRFVLRGDGWRATGALPGEESAVVVARVPVGPRARRVLAQPGRHLASVVLRGGFALPRRTAYRIVVPPSAPGARAGTSDA